MSGRHTQFYPNPVWVDTGFPVEIVNCSVHGSSRKMNNFGVKNKTFWCKK